LNVSLASPAAPKTTKLPAARSLTGGSLFSGFGLPRRAGSNFREAVRLDASLADWVKKVDP
jgi:hypothetical protein